MDLLGVSDDGSAVVHMTPQRVDQLEATAATLPEFGVREQVRWATLESFDMIPPEFRIDQEWLDTLPEDRPSDAIVELQPLLTRVEIDSVIRTISSLVQINAPRGQALRGTGKDFSGRQWLRGSLTPEALLRILTSLMSVQSLHSPLVSEVNGDRGLTTVSIADVPEDCYAADLPSVAVVDTGIPQNHAVLARFRRGGSTSPLSAGGTGSHASFVASRLVFGEQNGPPRSLPRAAVRFFDVNVALGPRQIDHKELFPGMDAVVRTAPDVRVFNLSFDSDPLPLLSAVKRKEELLLAQDLDNFIFQNDLIVVVAAGNSYLGVIPNTPYPRHYSELPWQLGAFARSFNSLTCGSYVSQLSASGLVRQLGWPSPFCRVGPGLASTPKPDFGASGGNVTENYAFAPGLGVWGIDPNGQWREAIGTSYAAPLLAREAALALRSLERVCEPGARPYAAAVKSFLALTADPAVNVCRASSDQANPRIRDGKFCAA